MTNLNTLLAGFFPNYNMMNAMHLRMFRPCLLLILCSQIDFNSVLNNNNSFLRYKISFFIVQSMRESMPTES